MNLNWHKCLEIWISFDSDFPAGSFDINTGNIFKLNVWIINEFLSGGRKGLIFWNIDFLSHFYRSFTMSLIQNLLIKILRRLWVIILSHKLWVTKSESTFWICWVSILSLLSLLTNSDFGAKFKSAEFAF